MVAAGELCFLSDNSGLCPSPLSKKEGNIVLHMLVGMSVSFSLVQLITSECFVLETSNLIVLDYRYSGQ